jgi:hypothetical protein
VLCGLGYALFALPTIVWTLSTLAQPSHPIRFREYLLYYYPYHTFVHVQWLALARYGAFLAAAAVAVWTAARELGLQGRVLAVIVASYGAVFLIGLPLPYLTDSRLLLNLYPLRIDAVVNVGVAATTLAWAGKRWAEERDSLPLAIALALLTGNMIAALWLLFVRARQGHGGTLVGVVLTSVGVVFVALRISPDMGDSFLPLVVIFAAASLCAAAAGGAFAVIPAGFAFALSAHALHRGTVERPDADLGPDREAQLWLRRHTAPDTAFLPVGVAGFSLLSRRPAWVDAQAGAAVMWKPIYLDEWWPRIHAVNACKTDGCFVDLARRNGIGWIVARADKFANVPGLSQQFTNRRYRILRVEGVAERRREQGPEQHLG